MWTARSRYDRLNYSHNTQKQAYNSFVSIWKYHCTKENSHGGITLRVYGIEGGGLVYGNRVDRVCTRVLSRDYEVRTEGYGAKNQRETIQRMMNVRIVGLEVERWFRGHEFPLPLGVGWEALGAFCLCRTPSAGDSSKKRPSMG